MVMCFGWVEVMASHQDDAAGRFDIDVNTGEITSEMQLLLDREANASHKITVEVVGGDGNRHQEEMTVVVNNVNEPPAGTDKNISILEDGVHVFSAGDFIFTDVENNNLLEVVFTTLPVNGSFELDGIAVPAGQSVAMTDINAGRLEYRPDANQSGVPYDSLQFKVRDDGGTDRGGVDTDQVANAFIFNVDPVNDPPIKSDQTITMDEDQPYNFTPSNFSFSDIEDHDLLEVVIETLPAAGTLEFNGIPVTAGQVIPAASVGLLVYAPDPDAFGTPYSTFDIRVRDNGGVAGGGADLSASSTVTFNFLSVNDPPSGSDFSVVLNEDASHNFSAADFVFSDVENDGLQAIVITSLPADGTLSIDAVAVSVGQSVAIGDIGRLVFTPALHANGSPYTSFNFRLQDDGGVANGGVDISVDEYTVNLDVLPVNDPPVGNDFLITTNEETTWSFTAAEFGIDDVESHAIDRVIISTLPQNGTLTNNGSPVAPGEVIFLTSIGDLEYTPELNGNGTGFDNFTFRIADDGGLVNSGDDTANSTNRVDINVVNVNDAPAGIDMTLSVDEDNTYRFDSADFGFTDIDNDQLQSIIIETLPAGGLLSVAGTQVAAGDIITAGSITSLTYSPAQDSNGLSYDSLSFRIVDDGGVLNGGSNADATPNTLTFNVTPVNDVPVGRNSSVTTTEDTAYNFSISDFPFSDTEDDSLRSVTVTALPANGELRFNGVPVVVGQEIVRADISSLAYLPPLNANGNSVGSFSFQIRDDGGVLNSGIDLDPIWRAMMVDVLSVNDPPSGRDNNISVTEDTGYHFDAVDFGFSDTDGDSFRSIAIDTLPSNGQLRYQGVPVLEGLVIDVSTAGALVFVPEANAHGQGYDTFSFTVIDDGGTAFGGSDTSVQSNNINIDLISVSDAPTGADNTVVTSEDVVFVFSDSDFGFNDIDGDDFLSVVIDTLPAVGQLQFDILNSDLRRISPVCHSLHFSFQCGITAELPTVVQIQI